MCSHLQRCRMTKQSFLCIPLLCPKMIDCSPQIDWVPQMIAVDSRLNPVAWCRPATTSSRPWQRDMGPLPVHGKLHVLITHRHATRPARPECGCSSNNIKQEVPEIPERWSEPVVNPDGIDQYRSHPHTRRTVRSAPAFFARFQDRSHIALTRLALAGRNPNRQICGFPRVFPNN